MAHVAFAEPIVTVNVNGDDSLHGTAELVSHELGLVTIACDTCRIDVSVTRVAVATTSAGTAVTAQLGIAISDARGVIVCVLAGEARATSATRRPVRGVRLAALRADAISAAIAGLVPKIASALRPHRKGTRLATMRGTRLDAPRTMEVARIADR